MNKFVKLLGLATILTAMLGLSACNTAEAASDGLDPKHKLVIQVSSSDPLTQKIALNNAVNIQKAYGVDNVAVEIVAYGPGLGMLTAGNGQTKRVESLAVQGITFSACGNTIKGVTKKKGKAPVLTAGVKVVPAGVQRIIELQEQGYSYIRP
ncbi:DsrE family protein [Sulfuriflexus sp.]|uniref:DsrE family protein n=1 Tax=Sulfuriflexus sp. TaxID=2015443 RepID=UPI0028CBFA1F|nr:DsrE family protein [Sulfuriflexus sp.]MDT8405173.1 DsrE family protein [Sulfuriflexus sp.]